MKKDMKILEWRLHAKSLSFKSKLRKAKSIIEEALGLGNWCVSWSTGKDSTALTHIARAIVPDMPILIQFDDCDWPEKQEYADRIKKAQSWDYIRVEPNFSVWDMASGYKIGHDNVCAQSHALTKDGFISILDDARKLIGCGGVMLGLRMAESRARKLNLCKRGHTYQLKDGSLRCNPLSIWDARDVFAYLIINNVEINPCYFKNRFFGPEDIRLSWALPTPGGLTHGDMQHMRKYYPQQYARLRDLEVV